MHAVAVPQAYHLARFKYIQHTQIDKMCHDKDPQAYIYTVMCHTIQFWQ